MTVTHDANLRVMDDASINCGGRDGDPYGSYGNIIIVIVMLPSCYSNIYRTRSF